ncbi:MAG: PilX N-terminal domain-containing pilus assembly protein [Candidatus Eisenbacteria bacterium]
MRRAMKAGRNERGIALVMALISLLVIAVIAMFLMTSLTVERKLSGHDLRDSQALNIAEAGVGEALARVRNLDISLSTANPRSVAQIFLVPAGSVPVLGTDSVAIETEQPAGAWLNYSTDAKSKDALTVKFRTNPARTVIYKYDTGLSPAIQTTSGLPIYRVTSTGRVGQNRVRVQTDVIQKPFYAAIRGAFAAGVPISFNGNSDVCGFNHGANVPVGTRTPGCDAYRTMSGDLPGGWSTAAIGNSGSGFQNGSPPTSANNPAFYAGPWEMFGMGQSEFYTWVGPPINNEPSPPNGIFHLDDNGTTQDQSGDYAYNGDDGEGLLYIDGDMRINGNFTYKGIVYIEGDLDINGDCWILGALIVRGKTTVKLANGDACILYSSEAIQNALAKFGGQFVTLSWRQVPLD